MLSVVFYVACAGLALSVSLAAPVFVALLGREGEVALRLAFYLAMGVFLFAAPVLAIFGRLKPMTRIDNLILVAAVWILLPVPIALVLRDLAQLSFSDALFETISGLTSAGASVSDSLEDWPQAVIFWRAQLQWMGGALALLSVYAVLAPLGMGGLSLAHGAGRAFAAGTAGADDRSGGPDRSGGLGEAGRLGGADRSGELSGSGLERIGVPAQLLLVYAVLTLAAFALFMVSGARSFHAACLAMAAVSTGGFLPFDQDLDIVLGGFGLFVFGLFLTLGATGVFWHLVLLRPNWRERGGGHGSRRGSIRARYEGGFVLATVSVMTLLFAFLLIGAEGAAGAAHILGAVIEGFFNAASLAATSGIESRAGAISLAPLPLVLFIALLGGSAFSTCGGLKHYRIGAMIAQSWKELDRLIYPNFVHSSRFGSQIYDFEKMKAVWSFFVIAILVLCGGTLFMAAYTPSFEAAISVSVSAFATAGPIYESAWRMEDLGASWPPFGDFPAPAKWALMGLMVLGRLEVLALVALLSVNYWRTR